MAANRAVAGRRRATFVVVMAILLVRHGETLGNRNRVLQYPDTPLSDRGLEQAARVGRRLAAAPVEEIWSSPLSRARMTADAIEKATRVPLREVEDLQERNFGALRGRAYADLGFDPFMPDYEPPEGESWDAFFDRIDRAWEQVERHWVDRYAKPGNDKHLIVVSHGLFLRTLIERRLLDDEERERHGIETIPMAMGNTAVTVVAPEPRADAWRHRLELIGCTRHLDDATQHDAGSIVGI